MRLESLSEGVLLALDQLWANKLRTTLTILGVVVGVGTVMLMAALIVGIRSSIMESIETLGHENFMVAPYDLASAWTTGPRADSRNPPITPAEIGVIEQLPEVRRTVPGIDHAAELDAGRDRLENVAILGRGSGWAEFAHADFIRGSNFLETDVDAAQPLTVLSQPLAEALYGPLNPVGRQIRIDGRAFQVSGVFQTPSNIFTDVVRNFAVVPYTTVLRQFQVREDQLGMFVETATGVRQDQAIDQVVAAMRTMRKLRPGEPDNFAVVRQDQLIQTFNQLTSLFFIVMLALSSIGLMVGGVGVIAIMMIAVTERTREIGVRKAIGATRKEILWQFLVEAATLTVIGAAIGMIGGGGLAFLVQALTPIPASVPLWAVAAALTTAAVTGMLFGLWPAWRAARMDPVEALRYE